MRKLLIASALTIASAMAIISCNNGPYDAHPDTDYSSGLNPASPDSGGVNVYLGSMEARINNKKLLLAPAFYYEDTLGFTRIIARVKNDSIFHRTLRITFSKFDGKKEYSVTADTTNPNVSFVMLDTSRLDLAGRKVYKTYTANTNEALGYATVNVQGNEGGHLRGYFFGKLYRILPEKKYDDTISIEFSPFYFEKVAFPVPAQYIQYLYN